MATWRALLFQVIGLWLILLLSAIGVARFTQHQYEELHWRFSVVLASLATLLVSIPWSLGKEDASLSLAKDEDNDKKDHISHRPSQIEREQCQDMVSETIEALLREIRDRLPTSSASTTGAILPQPESSSGFFQSPADLSTEAQQSKPQASCLQRTFQPDKDLGPTSVNDLDNVTMNAPQKIFPLPSAPLSPSELEWSDREVLNDSGMPLQYPQGLTSSMNAASGFAEDEAPSSGPAPSSPLPTQQQQQRRDHTLANSSPTAAFPPTNITATAQAQQHHLLSHLSRILTRCVSITRKHLDIPAFLSTLHLLRAASVPRAHLLHEGYLCECLLRNPPDLKVTPVLGFRVWYGDPVGVAVSTVKCIVLSGVGESPRLVLGLEYQFRFSLGCIPAEEGEEGEGWDEKVEGKEAGKGKMMMGQQGGSDVETVGGGSTRRDRGWIEEEEVWTEEIISVGYGSSKERERLIPKYGFVSAEE